MTSTPRTSETTFRDTKLDVPYLSQFLDVEHADWRPRACGMVCVAMVLRYFGARADTLDELIADGERAGGYGPSGWKHDYLVKVCEDRGFPCERREDMRERDVELFRQAIRKGDPVVVSVERVLFDKRDFHMVVLTGMRESAEGKLEGFFYHDPSSLKKDAGRYVPLPTFYLSWRRMAILPKRS